MAEVQPVIRAAGAVLWRPATTREGLEVAVVHRPKYDDWSLPKGKSEPGEHLLQTAVREVGEETGQRVSLGRPAGMLRYQVEGRAKVVYYWLARGHHAPFKPTEEVDELVWLPPSAAASLVTQPRDADVVRPLLWQQTQTTPFVLLRHAKAVKRSAWGGRDADRPLDPRGHAQSQALVDVLATLGPLTVVSSDGRRAVQTLAPYAWDRGVTVESEPLLSEEGWDATPAASLARIAELRDRREPMVVCSHRPLLPALVARLCEGSGVRPPSRSLDTAAFVVLHCSRGRVVAAEHHARPPVPQPTEAPV